MKLRNGFVSNSSSSSFVVERRYISEYQLEQIQNHMTVAKELNATRRVREDNDNDLLPYGEYPFYLETDDYDRWSIEVTDTTVEGYTNMNNFDMEQFMREVGVPMDKVQFES